MSTLVWWEDNYTQGELIALAEDLRSVHGNDEALLVLRALGDLESPGKFRPPIHEKAELEFLLNIKRYPMGFVRRKTPTDCVTYYRRIDP